MVEQHLYHQKALQKEIERERDRQRVRMRNSTSSKTFVIVSIVSVEVVLLCRQCINGNKTYSIE